MGVDEAGRGPVIGPLVLAGVVAGPEALEIMTRVGVRDSKTLSQRRREELLDTILEVSEIVVVRIVQPQEIDRENLNKIELRHIALMIKIVCDALSRCPERVYIDAVGDPLRGSRILRKTTGIESIVMETGAEERHVVVAAASIVAKVLREWYIERLRSVLGDFGSGYPSDPRTIEWLRENRDLIETLWRPYIRTKWGTLKRIQRQEGLEKYFVKRDAEVSR